MHLVTFSALSEFPAHLEAHVRAFPADKLDWVPQGEGQDYLSVTDCLRRILANEVKGYQSYITSTLTETEPVLVEIDVTGEAENGQLEVTAILAAFQMARQRTLSILADLSDEQWARTATFGVNGETSIIGLVHFLCSHDQAQLATLQSLLGKAEIL